MKDILKDIVSHTNSLGLELIKIAGTDKETTIESMNEHRTVVMQGETKKPIIELKGNFGMPNLPKLDLHLKNPEYSKDAKISVVWENRNGEDMPVMIHFENSVGDYKNDYKLMGAKLVNDKIKTAKFKGATWHVELEPSVVSINRFNLQSAANSDETIFLIKTENNSLKIFFGDANTHEGSFIFQTGITGKLKQNWTYPIGMFKDILALDGDKTLKISDEGVMLITIDSGIAIYNYYIPAQTK